jgi:hypothetical protein
MMRTQRDRAVLWAAVVGVGVASAALAQAGSRLILNGKLASTNVRLINGQPYVPLADIARATGQTLVKRSNGYEIVAAGGANQVEGLRGKVGDVLFDGKWRFRVTDVQRGARSYTIRREGGVDFGVAGDRVSLDADGKTFQAKPGYELVLVHARVTNGQKMPQAFGSAYGTNTALTDRQGTSYRPIGWDQEGGQITTKQLLPGAGQDLTAMFVIPEKTALKDLVFTLTNIIDRNPKDVRVTLEP